MSNGAGPGGAGGGGGGEAAGGGNGDGGFRDGGLGGGGFGDGGFVDGGFPGGAFDAGTGGVFVDGGIAASPGMLFIESNENTGNAIYAFRREADGALTAVPDGKVLTGGAGIAADSTQRLGPFEADQQLAITADGRFVLAVNTGSDSVAVLHFSSHGGLTPVAGSPFWSGGHNPVSLAVSGDHVWVANKALDGSTQPNYAVLTLSSSGQLTVLSAKQQRLPMGSSPSIAYLAPGGRQLFGTHFYDQSQQALASGWQIDAYAIDSEGSMTHAPNAPYLAPGKRLIVPLGQPPPLALNLVAHPRQSLLYVGLTSQNRLGVYSYDDLGSLTLLEESQVSSASWPAFFRIDQNGHYLYSSNIHSGSVSTWDLGNPKAPVEKSVLALLGSWSGTAFTSEPYQLSLDESGQHLYVLSQRVTTNNGDLKGNLLHVLDVGVAGLLDERLEPVDLTALGLEPHARPQGVLVASMPDVVK